VSINRFWQYFAVCSLAHKFYCLFFFIKYCNIPLPSGSHTLIFANKFTLHYPEKLIEYASRGTKNSQYLAKNRVAARGSASLHR
jgi:hypothetical protein